MTALGSSLASERTVAVLHAILGERLGRDVAVRLWDGSAVEAPEAPFTLVLATPFGLRAALTPPLTLSPGRAFV